MGPASAEVFDVLLVKMEVLHIVDNGLETRGDGVAALIGHVAEEDVEVADAVAHPLGKVAVAHGQLVEIAKHGQVDPVGSVQESTFFFIIARKGAKPIITECRPVCKGCYTNLL